MKRFNLKTLQLFLLLVVFCFPSFAEASNKIAAIVNDEVITQNQINQVIYILNQQNQAQGKSMSQAQLKKAALDQLIGNKLMLQIAKQNEITATDAEVNQQIKMITDQNGLSLEKFKQALIKDGTNFGLYKEFIKNQITLNKLHSQFLGSRIKISEKDIQAEMREAKKWDEAAPVQILDVLALPTSGHDMAKAKETLAKVRQQLLAHQELREILKAHENRNLKLTTQNLGWKSLNELPDLFANAVKTLPAGQVSEVIEAPNGVHLLIMLNRKNGGTVTRQEAENMAFHRKKQAEVEKWLVELKKQAYIEIK